MIEEIWSAIEEKGEKNMHISIYIAALYVGMLPLA